MQSNCSLQFLCFENALANHSQRGFAQCSPALWSVFFEAHISDAYANTKSLMQIHFCLFVRMSNRLVQSYL
jgi:hypothetical protein